MRNPEESLGYLLIQIGKQRRTKSNALLADTKIHAGQDMLLYYLGLEDGQTISALAEKMAVQPATVSTMVDRMVATGYLEKIKGTIDKRRARIFITDKGREAFNVVADAWNEVENQTTKGLSVIEKFMLKRLLDRVLTNLNQ